MVSATITTSNPAEDRPEKRPKLEPVLPGLLLTGPPLSTPPHPTIADITTSEILRLRVWDPLPAQTPKHIDFNLHVEAIKTKTKMLDYFLIHPVERSGKTTAVVDAAPFSIRQIGVGPDVFKCFVEWAYTGSYERALVVYATSSTFLEGRAPHGNGGYIPEGHRLKVHLHVYQCAKCLGCAELGRAAYKALFEILKVGIPLDREENDLGLAEALVMVFNPKDESQGLTGIREMLIAYLGSRLPEAISSPHIIGVISIIPNLSLALLRRVQTGKDFEAALPASEEELF